MNHLLAVLLLLFSFQGTAQTTGEEILSLDGTWNFRTDPSNRGEAAGWSAHDFNDQGWDSMPVPGNWDLRNEYAHYVGKAWYRKTISVSKTWKQKTVRLMFEAVSFDSKVWVNGRLVGGNNNGYLPFAIDISPYLHYGKNNSIVVMSDNTFRLGAIWNWGGIRRPVKLVATGKVYILGQSITPEVDLENKTAEVSIKIRCRNDWPEARKVTGEGVITGIGLVPQKLPFTLTIPAKADGEVTVRTKIGKEAFHLWHFDDPFLYNSRMVLQTGGSVLHEVQDRFGLRTIELDHANYTFRLNGEPVRLMGLNLVPDDRTTGNTLPLWRVKQDIDRLKAMGANMARLTHLPLHREMLDYLDERGMLVFSEIPLWGYHQLVDRQNPVPKQWLQRLIDDNYNHPSIIGWCVGNEIGTSPGAMDYVEDAIAYVKQKDTMRLGVMVSHTARREIDPIRFSDIGLINNYGKGLGLNAEKIHVLHPGKILFYTEIGYTQMTEDLDSETDAKGMIDSIRFKPFLVGASLWTWNDYRSSYTGTKEASENRPWGIVDVFRQKKKSWYAFRKEFAPVRELSLVPDIPKSTLAITITPRKLLDLPAYPLRDYWLLWKGLDSNGKLSDGGIVRLPLILPGDQDYTYTVKWKEGLLLSAIQLEIISPLHYTVMDTTVHLQRPAAPVIIAAGGYRTHKSNTAPNTGMIRIAVDRTDPTAFYKAKYGQVNLDKETAPTLNQYIEIRGLAYEETYDVAVVAVTGAGDSEIRNRRKVKLSSALAAPLITYVEPADQGFFVGYKTEVDDYVFKIQYTTEKGDYSKAATLQTTTKGVMFVPGLVNGKTYFFRMCRVKDNFFASEWSNELTVTPDGGMLPPAPNLKAVLRNGPDAVLLFDHVKKATGYKIAYRVQGTSAWTSADLNVAEVGHYRMSGLNSSATYEFRMRSLNAVGSSGWSASVIN